MPAGRPTLYDPKICDKVVELMKDGSSLASVALELDIDRDTLLMWQKDPRKPEFYLAIQKGLGYSQGWWETKGHKNLENSKFNYQGWHLNIKNRFRDDWKDKQDISISNDIAQELDKMRDKRR